MPGVRCGMLRLVLERNAMLEPGLLGVFIGALAVAVFGFPNGDGIPEIEADNTA